MIFPLSRYKVCGNSMLPTFKPGQDILCFNWAYLFCNPKKGDIVVFKKNGKEMVKRIQNVHEREYFVGGDNKHVCRCCGKRESIDSRSFGFIKNSAILGKVVFLN